MKPLLIILILLALLTGCGGNGDETTVDESTPVRTSSEGVIGQWVYTGETAISYITLYGSSLNILFQEEFADDTVYVAQVEEVKAKDDQTRRFNEINTHGEIYYVIDTNGDLQIYKFGKHERTASPK